MPSVAQLLARDSGIINGRAGDIEIACVALAHAIGEAGNHAVSGLIETIQDAAAIISALTHR
jgi:hypothetical protein